MTADFADKETHANRIAFVLALLMCALPAYAAALLVGHWAGTFTRQGASLPVALNFHKSRVAWEGDFSCTAQRCLQYPLDSVTATQGAVDFVIGGSMTFMGKQVGSHLLGTFQGDGAPGTFTLTRSKSTPFPYRVEEVRFRNGPVTLVGTLCIPATQGRHAAVIFTQGSGPETRWGTNRFWADRFARAGIAALCYDKRGCGASSGDWKQADFNDLARDCRAAFRLLQTRADIDLHRTGIAGHSQGGFIAPLIAAQCPGIAFIIAADSPGGPAYEQDEFRVRTLLADNGFTSADIARTMTFFCLFLHVARTGEGWDALNAALPQARKEKWYDSVAPPPRGNWLYGYYKNWWHVAPGLTDLEIGWVLLHTAVRRTP